MPDEIWPVPTTRAKRGGHRRHRDDHGEQQRRSAAPPAPAARPGAGSGEMPMTISASVSSRTVRAPRSEQIADPTAPAIISDVTSGAPCRSTPMPLTAPMNDWAPIWLAAAPIWTDVMTPNGIDTRIVGQQRHPRHEPALEQELGPGEATRDDVGHDERRPTPPTRITRSPVVMMPAFARSDEVVDDRPPTGHHCRHRGPFSSHERRASRPMRHLARSMLRLECLLLGVTDITRKRHTCGKCPRSDTR